MDLGFEKAGGEVVWANECEAHAAETYRRNFPGVTLDTRSILAVESGDIPACDVVIGGPPCQSFSMCGRRRGFDDRRGQMIHEFFRVVRDLSPRAFVMENVPALAHKTHRTRLSELMARAEGLGYTVSVAVLRAEDFGVAQTRRRLFMVGVRPPTEYVFPAASTTGEGRRVLRDVIEDLSDSAVESDRWKTASPAINGHEYVPASCVGRSKWFLRSQRVRAWDEPGYTVMATPASISFHPSSPKMIRLSRTDHRLVPGHAYRRLTVRECARIQGFPDAFAFSYTGMTAAHRMVGNAVPPPLAEAVMRPLVEALSR